MNYKPNLMGFGSVRRAMTLLWMAVSTIMHAWILLISGSGNSVLAQVPSFSQELQGKLDQYYSASIPLVLDLQFNQPAYVPGDTAWFSLWLTTEREGLPVAGRQIIQMNVVGRDGEVLLKQCVLVNNGLAHAQIVVPASFSSDIYTVVAWTDWMANGSNEVYGYKELVVTGQQKMSPVPMPLRAFPEGGFLVQGISNRVVITGKPNHTASLTSGQQLVSTVSLNKHGYGQVVLTPDDGHDYVLSDGSETVQLNTVNEGLAMALNFYDTASTLIFDLQSPRFQKGDHLAIVSRGKVVYSALISFQDNRASITIPKKALPEGLMLATLFDEHNEVIGERLLLANAPSAAIRVTADRSSTRPRERIPVTVEAPALGGIPITVSIYAEDLFSSELGSHNAFMPIARLPRGGLDFQIDPFWTLREWNDFLVTQSWKRFQWDEVLNGKHESGHQFAKYLKFKGKVLLPDDKDSFDSVRVTFFLRHEARVYEDYVDRTGVFNLEMFFDFDNVEEVIYTIDRKGVVLKEATIKLDEEVVPVIMRRPYTRSPGTDSYAAFASLRATTAEAYRSYEWNEQNATVVDPNAAVEDELFEADVTVNLNDYILFPDMEETLREIVPKLQHRWRGKRHTVRVALSEPDLLATADPLYFIDGVLTDDTDYFMELNPKDVVSIKIVSLQQRLFALGILGRNGVVLVTTKRPVSRNVPTTLKSFRAIGLTRPIVFNNTSGAGTRTPLLRSSVYLNPALVLNAEGKAKFEFVVPDNLGRFRIEVTGLSKSGVLYKATSDVRSLPPTSPP